MEQWRTKLATCFPELTFWRHTEDFHEALLELTHRVWLPALDANDARAIGRTLDFWEWVTTTEAPPCETLFESLETMFFDVDQRRRKALYQWLTPGQFDSIVGTLWYSRVNREPESFDPKAEYHRTRNLPS